MTSTAQPTSAPPSRGTPPRTATAASAAARGLGELLITAGVVLLLFVAYQLVWTNIEAERAQGRVAEQIRADWQRPPASGAAGEGRAGRRASDSGPGFAFMRIPRLGRDYNVPVLEGVGLDVLAKGVGHYPGTAMPGQVGNFAVAGHRATNGEPFAYLDRLRPGDAIVVETRTRWLTYVVDSTRIVQPTDVWVIDPVPGKPDAVPRERLITLTTCNPRWASYERLIVFGQLEDARPKSDGPPPQLRRGA